MSDRPSVAPGLDLEAYEKLDPRAPEKLVESAVPEAPETDGECEACHRDLPAGRDDDLCETCAHVEREIGIPVRADENGDESPSDAFDDLEGAFSPDEEEDDGEGRESAPEADRVDEMIETSREIAERGPEERGGEASGQIGFGDGFGEIEKPDFSLPTMDEIRSEMATSGFDLVSTFSGCGGTSLGFRWAGFDVLWANEFVPSARQTYLANFPDSRVDDRDIREIEPADVLEEIDRDVGEVDVLEGGPPCAAFSVSGNRDFDSDEAKKYSETEQRVDDLFWEFLRFAEGLEPKVVLIENVPALVTGAAEQVFRKIVRKLRKTGSRGYVVDARTLNAAAHGAAQRRKRLFIQGVRRDLFEEFEVRPAYPRGGPHRYSIREALAWNGPLADGHEEDRREADISEYAIGEQWRGLDLGEQSEKYFNLIRPDPDRPCPTVTQSGASAGAASVTHPTEERKFTPAELRRICGFPDDFVLEGDFEQRYERLGRAVPPPLSRSLAEAIREEILRPIDEDR